jgi:hypothetical protein
MRRILRVFLVVLLPALLVSVPSGCGKDPGKPNQDLKVPDVAPSDRSKEKGGGPRPVPKP